MFVTRDGNAIFECLWILDCSGSMGADACLQKAVQYIKEVHSVLADVLSHESPGIDVRCGLIAGGTPMWLVPRGTHISDVVVPAIRPVGHSPLGELLTCVADSQIVAVGGRERVTLTALFSDGDATDAWQRGVAKMRLAFSTASDHRVAVSFSERVRDEVLGAFVSPGSGRMLPSANPTVFALHAATLTHMAVRAAAD